MFNWLKKSVGRSGGGRGAENQADPASLMAQATEALNAGDLEKAAQCYQQAVSLDPNNPALRAGLGVALIRQASYAEAKTQLNRAILLDPANANTYYLLGNIAQKQGDLPAAIELYNEALELKPDLDDACGELTNALLASGRKEVAEAMLIAALAARPGSAQLHFILGTLYARSHEPEKAEQCYQTSLLINPASYEAHSNLGSIFQMQGMFTAAIASFERAMQIGNGHVAAHSNLLWALSFQGDGTGDRYVREARRFGQDVLTRAIPYLDWLIEPSVAGKPRALRVGFVSGDLRRHPVMAVLEDVLRHLNPAKLELMAYSMNPLDDEVTARIKGCFSQWTSIVGLSDEAVAHRIHGDRVDILIDLAGHSAYNRLPVFAWKPAPVQVSWLGYLASTGVPGIDYVLADPVSTPEAVWDQFTETVWHLPETFNCFTPPAEHPKLSVVPPPARRNGYITFGSFQRINKLSDITLGLWGRILKAQPRAKLWLRSGAMNSQQAHARLLSRLDQAGIVAARVTFGGNIPGREDYLAAYGEVDMILDTFPYPGVTTTFDALWMGVPTVTLAKGGMLGRIGASLLTCAGLKEWVAWDEDEYVALALKHASNLEGLTQLRAELRRRVAATPLFDAARFAPQLEEALFAMWQRKMAGPTVAGEAASAAHGAAPEVTSNAVNDESIGTSQARLGAHALAQGDLTSAARHYLQAVQYDPSDADAQVALGFVLIEQGRHAQAKPHLEAASRAAPANADAWYLLGKIAQEERDLPAVLGYFSRALDLRPGFDAAFNDLAALYFANRKQEHIASAILGVVQHRPERGIFHHCLGNLFDGAGELDNAAASYREALLLRPAEAATHCNLGHVLLKLGDIEPAGTHMRRAIAIKPDYFSAYSNLLWMLSFYADDVAAEYVAEARRYGQRVMAAARPFTDWQRTSGADSRRLRVGLVSGDFRAHPVGFFLEGVLRNLNPAKLELLAYSMNPQDDEMTGRIKASFAQWIPIGGWSDEQAARKIHADGVDILIDVAGHSAGNRLPLFAWKPAPVQVTWLGYLASTGVPGIDYVLADPISTPETVRDQFTEEVWHLPETLFCFTPPAEHPKISVAPPPALRNGYITFGSFQRLNKLSDTTLGLWGRVLKAQPQAKLWLRNEAISTRQMHERLLSRLVQAGIETTRVTFGDYLPAWEDYLTAYNDVDVMLDTFPHPGATTTCEALWMGVPTVTLAQGRTLGRIGASFLTCAGLKEWVAWNEDEYVALALKHTSDVERLARLRAGLRQQVAATPLFDAVRFAPQLEDALFAMWQRKMAVPERASGGALQEAELDAKSSAVKAESQSDSQKRLGAQALARGDLALAHAYYRQAAHDDPSDADAQVALGFVLTEQGRFAEARPHLEAALQTAPANADAWYLLAKVAQEAHDILAVLNHLTRALDLRPAFDAAFSDLAALFFSNREHETLASTIFGVVHDRPERGLFHHHLGNCFDVAGEPDNAAASYREALLHRPDEAMTHCNLGHVLLQLGDMEPAHAHMRRAIEIKPDYFSAHSNLLWMLSFYVDDMAGAYVEEARCYGRRVMDAIRPFTRWTRRAITDGSRLRVGLVSGDFRAHPVGYFLEGVLRNLNPAKLELIAYSINPRDDEMSERLKICFAQWISIAGMDDEEAAHKIHADGVDLLIDLAGHGGNNRLPVFAWKPAPVQVSWLGYLASTGVPGMDYVLADKVAAPEAIWQQFTEEIWHLPETFNCYTPLPEHPKLVVTAPPALRNGFITFGSFQRLNKLGDESLKLWGRVLQALPQARIRLQNGYMDKAKISAKLRARMASAGIPLERCILHGGIDGKENHLAAHAQVDIILDTLRYPGTTTTCEALWMGVPTLTLAGDTLLRRVGASVLTCAGLPGWIARDEEEYVALAVRHGSDIEALARLRAGLRRQVAATALFDAGRFAPQLEEALLAMWRRKTACSTG